MREFHCTIPGTSGMLVTDYKETSYIPRKGQTTTGYGHRLPTRHMLKVNDRWRRVLATCFGNTSYLYIQDTNGAVHGVECIIDDFKAYHKSFETRHKAIWNYLSDNPQKSKRSAFTALGYELCSCLCFACAYTRKRNINSCYAHVPRVDCNKCPIDAPTDGFSDSGMCLHGLFDAWSEADDECEKSTLAKKIADLKWNYYI